MTYWIEHVLLYKYCKYFNMNCIHLLNNSHVVRFVLIFVRCIVIFIFWPATRLSSALSFSPMGRIAERCGTTLGGRNRKRQPQ